MKKNSQLIVSSNDLIEAKYNFSLWQKRVFVYMVSLINKNDKGFNLQRIYVRDLLNFFAVKSRDDYDTIMRVPESLFNSRIHVPYYSEEGLKRWRNTRIISTYTEPADRDERNSYIELQFNNDLKEHLLELHETFTKYDIRNIIELRSVYSFRMYELLKSRRYRRDLLTIGVDELKEILDVETKYKNYADFKRFVLMQGQKDLAKFCDIAYTFQEKKEGKKVKILIFNVFDNQSEKSRIKESAPQNQTLAVLPSEATPLFAEIFMKVKGWGISSEVLQLLIETQPEEALRNGVEYTEWAKREGKIKDNVAGFFITAVKNRYTTPQYEAEKKRVQNTKVAKQQAAEVKQLNAVLKTIKEEYQTAINGVVRGLTEVDATVVSLAVAAIKAENKGYFALKGVNPDNLTLENFREDKILRGMVIQQIQVQNPTHFAEINEKFKPQIQNLEAKIKGLQ